MSIKLMVVVTAEATTRKTQKIIYIHLRPESIFSNNSEMTFRYGTTAGMGSRGRNNGGGNRGNSVIKEGRVEKRNYEKRMDRLLGRKEGRKGE